MIGFTSRLGLRQLIICLGLLGLVGVVSVASIYFVSNAALSRQQDKADKATELGQLALMLDNDLLGARRAEKDFLLRKEERYIARHAEISEKVRAALTGIEQKAGD